MRVTNEIRKSVLKTLTRQVFQSKLNNVANSMVQVIGDVATDFHKDAHERAISLGKENEDLLIIVNRRFSLNNFDFKLSGFKLLDTNPFNADRWGRVRSLELQFFTSRAKCQVYELEASDKDLSRLKRLVKQIEKLGDEYEQFVIDMNAVLMACNTKKQLLEVLPEAETLLPEQPTRLPVPAEKAKILRRKIKSAA